MPIAPLPSENVKTSYEYGPAGMTKLIAWQSGTIGQQTEYVYGVTSSTSGITSNDIVGVTKWPDKTTGISSSSEQETVTVNALGEVVTSTDRNGSVHTITRDILGRVVSDAVTTLASGVDGSVRRIDTAYDSQGNPYLVTSYDAVTGGSIVNQVQRAYNGLGQMTDEWQQVGAAVNTSTSPRVQYVWSTLDSNNHSRLVAMVYPSGYTVDYNYASGLDSDISRLSSMSDTSGTLESYGYLGAGSILTRTNGAGVVQATTLDDLGRVAGVSAVKGSTTLDGYGYTYDRNSNRLTRSNATNSAFDEAYTYDGTNQLTGFTRGSDSKDWGFDALGNRTSVTTNGGTPDTWTANAQNQITGIGGATTPTYDANGNMTGDEQGRTLVYDSWNRLVLVKSGSTVLKAYSYDGGNRKITEDDGTTVTQLVYSAAWQVLEEKVGSSYTNRYVWSVAYVDALVMRDDGTQRIWAIQDANWNVTALVDDFGNVLERFGYDDPYGKVTVYDASWNVKSGGSDYAWVITFQGMRYDAGSDNFYQRNRWYSPSLGRWITVDPKRFAAGDLNLYRIEENGSTNKLDPSGLENVEVWITFSDSPVTSIAAQWHSTFATINGINPFLDTQVTIKAKNLDDAVNQLKKRLKPGDTISQLEFASHGSPGKWMTCDKKGNKERIVIKTSVLDGFLKSNDPNKFVDLRYIKGVLAKDAKIILKACDQAKGDEGVDFCTKLAKAMDRNVQANDGTIAAFGWGQWWEFSPDGSKNKP